jgi:uncharacterized membrane protein
MRPQRLPWDLVLIVGLTVAVSGTLLAAGVGNLAAILFFLFAPGYASTAAIFPGNRGIRWTERLALSVGLSLAVVPLLALLLSFTPFGIALWSLLYVISGFTFATASVAFWRRLDLPEDERLSFGAERPWLDWSGQRAGDKAITIALAASIVFAGSAFAYVVLIPKAGDTYTEFFLLGPNGTAEDYPETLNISEPAAVTIVVVNHEAANVSYVVNVDLVGVRTAFNATTGRNETVEVNRTAWDIFGFSLDHGAPWVRQYRFQIDAAGDWRIDFLLYRNPEFQRTYGDLFLRVTVGVS